MAHGGYQIVQYGNSVYWIRLCRASVGYELSLLMVHSSSYEEVVLAHFDTEFGEYSRGGWAPDRVPSDCQIENVGFGGMQHP